MRADLHAHPFVKDPEALTDLLQVLQQKNITLLAYTTHGRGDPEEPNFWHLKKLIKKSLTPYERQDLGSVIRLKRSRHFLNLTCGIEEYCCVPGLRGKLCLLIIAPDRELLDHLQDNMVFEDLLHLGKEHKGLVIASHPYTLWDPYGPKGFIKFRLADRLEREVIRKTVFPRVDAVDKVATNVAWMTRSNDMLEQDYPGRTLCSSDTHAVSPCIRQDIGKSGCVFPNFDFQHSDEFRKKLKSFITNGEFETYLQYVGPINFLRSIAFYRPSRRHP